jgi:hypothetical protein
VALTLPACYSTVGGSATAAGSGGEERSVMVLLVLLTLLCCINIYLLYRIWGLEHQLTSKV